MNRKQRFRRDAELVKRVLRRWNPIGVPLPADEYDSYAPQLLSLLYARDPKAELTNRLHMLRTAEIGMPPSRQRDEEIAAELIALELHDEGTSR